MADIRFYNTLTHRVDRFKPIEPPHVFMYNCGPTVYDFAHIGNFRAFVFADVLRRFLEFAGYEVHQVMNLTDVGHMTEDQVADGAGEDKMRLATRRLKEAKKRGEPTAGAVEDPEDPYQIAEYYTAAFLEDARALNLKVADEGAQAMPRATRHIDQMQAMIRKLIERGHAYVVPAGDEAEGGGGGGAVYYSVESFPDYGTLSGNTLEKLRGGAGGRVTLEQQASKRHPADFLLWKTDPSHLMKWDSPWGVGYPGWHIECSSMAAALLGRETIDIHTGGEDNIFPHHECEIAQARGASGRPSFANHWMHTRFLLVEGQKMSKSKGNFYTVRDVLEGGLTDHPVDPAVLRFELLKAHHRSNMNFTRKGLEDSASAVRRLRETAARLHEQAGGDAAAPDPAHPTLRAFREALSDDLNMAGALGRVFAFVHGEHPDPATSLMVVRELDRVLGVLSGEGKATGQPPNNSAGVADEVAEQCRRIDQARGQRDFAAADALRKQLIDRGYEVKTTQQGTHAVRKLA